MNESASCTSLNDTTHFSQDSTNTSLKNKTNNTTNDTNTSQNQPQPSFGLKLILKRQYGNKYEIKNPNTSNSSNCSFDSSSSRPRREAARKVKFKFEDEDSPVKKRPKYTPSVSQPRISRPKIFLPQPETCIPFEQSDLVEKTDGLLNEISNYQVKISINHSVPFPIALVEDKTNIVHTKALLLIHLYQSYSSPCIICVLCKNFFSIPTFSKHFHISEDDLDTDSSGDELDQGSYHTFLSELDERKERKLRKLRKKSYKILPYFLNQNNELNQNQLKTWKLFSSKFTFYKTQRQTKLDEQKELDLKKEQEKLAKKRANSIRPKSRRRPDPELRNWDFICDEKEDKYFYTNRNRLECEKIVYLKKNGRRLSDVDTESDTEKKCEEPKRDRRLEILKKSSTSTAEPDLSLSEDDESEVEIKPRMYFFYEQAPSRLEKQFNYYDNLSPEVIFYLNNDPVLVPNLSLLMYKLSIRSKEKLSILLAETNGFRLRWLADALDLELTQRKI